MKLQDIRTLTLLEQFDNGKQPTQRELAEKLDISLGLVNLYLKRLVQKSYFKVKTYPKHRVGYLLTPNGIKEKARLAGEYIQYSMWFYSQTRSRLKRVLQDQAAQGVRTIVFYGANEIAEIAYLTLKEKGMELVAVIDDKKAGETFMGQPILSCASLESLSFDRLLDNTMPATSDKLRRRQPLPIPREKVLSVLLD
jgi:DNA-binding MarR family transcriptional regulator